MLLYYNISAFYKTSSKLAKKTDYYEVKRHVWMITKLNEHTNTYKNFIKLFTTTNEIVL